ncbi:hypothetical protein [Micromonospora sp. NPDC049799]|uniref:hypothetical protein n=1 Tax=Micromonospora sp. NPDC049799 TaxID=3154741 RepID=UPI0033F9D970
MENLGGRRLRRHVPGRGPEAAVRRHATVLRRDGWRRLPAEQAGVARLATLVGLTR